MRVRTALAILTAALFAAAIAAAAIALSMQVRKKAGESPDWRDRLRIGYAIEAPYAFLDDAGAAGQSPDLAKAIVDGLGVAKVEWINCEFSMLVPKLEAGEIDLVASGLFITPERESRVAFSSPCFKVREGLLTTKGNPLKLKSYKQAAKSGAKIAVVAGSVELLALNAYGIPKDKLLAAPDALTAKIAVENGYADALALSSPTVRWMAANDQSGKLEAVEDLEQSGPESLGAFAFRKSDRELLAAWNGGFAKIVRDGKHLAIVGKYGFTERDLPRPPDGKEAR